MSNNECSILDASTFIMGNSITEELMSNYMLIAHDGNGLKGEHYEVSESELLTEICRIIENVKGELK